MVAQKRTNAPSHRSPVVDKTPSNTWFLGPTHVFKSKGILIGSATFAGLTIMTNRQTDHATLCNSWLRQRVEFKLACLVHQSLAEQTLSYLASNIQLTTNTGRPQLRSASERICVVPRTHNIFGNRSFSAAGPRVWNALPSYQQQDMNYSHFKHSLKGHTFRL